MNPTTSTSPRRRVRAHSRRWPAGQLASANAARRTTSERETGGRPDEQDVQRNRTAMLAKAPTDAVRRALSLTPMSPDERTVLWAMTPAERVEAMCAGELALVQLCKWTSRRPLEVPLLGGEFSWIVMKTPEWAEAGDAHSTAGDAGSTT